MNASMRFIDTSLKLDFKDVLIVPRKSNVHSRNIVNLNREFYFRTKPLTSRWEGVPIISSNMDTVSSLETFDVLKNYNYISCFPKYLNKQWLESIKLPNQLHYSDYYMLSCGINEMDCQILMSLIDRMFNEGLKPKFICIDVANGYLTKLLDVCSMFRERYPQMIIAAGNVVTPNAVKDIIKTGANMVKVGCGSGSACTTRLKTGIGYPQLSVILECAEVAHANGGHLISDGGIVYPGDIAKAFVAGTDFVMLGSMLAGHSESPGELQLNPKDNKWYKAFYGMSSEDAIEKHNGGMKNYRTAEGKSVMIKYKGSMANTIKDINGGLRSACTYLDARNIPELMKNGEFILVNTTHNTSLG